MSNCTSPHRQQSRTLSSNRCHLRQDRLRLLLALVILLASAVLFAHADNKRPHILIAFADDWGKYASAYAARTPGTPNDVLQTPHFDRIAREGVLFHNAFVTSPSCTPCRSSLLSGQYFWRTGRGAILQGAVWDNTIPTYPLLLKDAGYHIGHSYKVWAPGTPRNAPYGADTYAYNRFGNRFNRFSQTVSAAKNPDRAQKDLLNEVRRNFQDFLSKRPADSPFSYWFGPTNCHRKWIQGSGAALWGLQPESLKGKLPPFLPDVPTIREDFADYLGEVQAFDAAVGVLIEELERIGELENTLILVSGDHGIPGFPRAKCNLYDFGVAVPLAVRWGNTIAPNRQVDDFVNLMDLAPTFLEAAGVEIPFVMTGKSLVPVLQAVGSGQIDLSRDFVVTGRERHVAAARPGFLPYPQRAIRTADFLYIRNFKPDRWPMGIAPGFGLPSGSFPSQKQLEKDTFVAFADLDASPTKAYLGSVRNDNTMKSYVAYAFGRRSEEELYDLTKDPHQLHNVASQAFYQAVKTKLAARLNQVLEETKDPRIHDEPIFERPPYAGPLK
ncbi:MAG: Choline-sulfatase [Verrucomicrobia subdivision 3 bacterium]|nr:Choline-sulfatase [Limisphaerales bacterium]MCS1412310.1 Choline-sulfatase [Limisphaerales bacterium]